MPVLGRTSFSQVRGSTTDGPARLLFPGGSRGLRPRTQEQLFISLQGGGATSRNYETPAGTCGLEARANVLRSRRPAALRSEPRTSCPEALGVAVAEATSTPILRTLGGVCGAREEAAPSTWARATRPSSSPQTAELSEATAFPVWPLFREPSRSFPFPVRRVRAPRTAAGRTGCGLPLHSSHPQLPRSGQTWPPGLAGQWPAPC